MIKREARQKHDENMTFQLSMQKKPHHSWSCSCVLEIKKKGGELLANQKFPVD